MEKQGFLVVIELDVTKEYVEHLGGRKLASQAIAGAMSGLLNPAKQTPINEWKVVDVTAYPLAG